MRRRGQEATPRGQAGTGLMTLLSGFRRPVFRAWLQPRSRGLPAAMPAVVCSGGLLIAAMTFLANPGQGAGSLDQGIAIFDALGADAVGGPLQVLAAAGELRAGGVQIGKGEAQFPGGEADLLQALAHGITGAVSIIASAAHCIHMVGQYHHGGAFMGIAGGQGLGRGQGAQAADQHTGQDQ